MNQCPNISKYNGILFDRDGTLFDSNDVMSIADEELICSLGATLRQSIQDEWANFYRNYTGNDGISLVWAAHLIDTYNLKSLTANEYLEHRSNILNERIRKLPYKDNADKFLIALRDMSIQLAIVTLGDDASMNLYRQNEKVNATAPIDFIFGNNIVTSDLVKRNGLRQKPEPDPNLLALKMLGLMPEECLIFEDSLIGLISAQRAGIDICITYDSHSNKDREALKQGTPYHISNFGEMLNDLLY